MSPSLASSSTWAGSFFSSPSWKRVFSSRSTSPFFILAIASSAVLPMQSVAKATGRLMMLATAAATGLSELASSGPPLGRPKCASRMTLPPLSAISVMVDATRSMRVASVTRPFSVGTLRSTRNSTRLPAKSASSSVRKGLLMSAPLKLPTAATRSSSLPFCHARGTGPAIQPRPFERGFHDTILDPRFRGGDTRSLDQLGHRDGRVRHAVREAPFVVIPGKHAHEFAVDHLGLIEVEDRGAVVVIEIARDVWLVGIAEDALERPVAVRSRLDRVVDLVRARLALGDKFEVDYRDVWRRHADRGTVQLALEIGQHETDRFRGAGRGRAHRQRRAASAVEILVQRVERRLIAGVGVDGRHEPMLDADRVVEHLGDRRQAIGRA